jgi:hypothetical protein
LPFNTTQKKQIINENKDPKNKVDSRAIRIRSSCQTPLNVYRTCYERALDPSNNVEDDDFVLRNPFSQPFIDHDEWMVADTMHLELTQKADEKGDEVNCIDTLALEEISLKYLKDNLGGVDTFSPICSLISESAIKNEVVNDGSGRVVQTIALKLDLVFAFKRTFAKEIESSRERHWLRHLQISRNLATRAGFGMCCSSKAFNSKSAKGSATCGGGGGSSRCSKKKKKPSRTLFESSTLPDFYQQEFDVVLDEHTAFEPEQTRGVLEAKSTEDVAACAVNRFIEDVLNVPSMTCEKYQKYECSSNEDLVQDADDRACDLGIIHPVDGNHTETLTTANPTTATAAEPTTPCNDNDNCTTDAWHQLTRTCSHTPVSCPTNQSCDPADG